VIGARVRVIYDNDPLKVGTVIAESEDSVGVRFDDEPDVPAIVPKQYLGVIL
jgi:hypothetical protein